MKRFFIAVLASVCVSSAVAAEDARRVFDSLYSGRIKQAAATVDRADDVALAKVLLNDAKASGETPELLALLCDAAYELGQRHADGYPAAAEAMTLLMATVPAARVSAREKLIDILTKQSRVGKTPDRDAAGERLIEVMLELGDEKLEAKKWTEAAAEYRKALAVASPKKSPQTDEVKARLDAAMRRDRAEKQIARLQEKLLADANDSASAEELVRLHMVELDDPATAATFLNRVKSDILKKLVPLAAKPMDAVATEDLLALGEWYRSLASSAPGQSDLPLLHRAAKYLARFKESPSATGLLGRKAEVLLNEIEPLVKKLELGQTATSTSKVINVLSWIDASWLDTDKSNRSGTWRVEKGQLSLTPVDGWNVLYSNIQVSGSYDVRFKFTPTSGVNGYILQLPIASKHLDVVIGGRSGEFHSISRWRDDGKDWVNWWKPGKLKSEQAYLVEVQVRQSGTKVTTELSIDGKKVGGWTDDRNNIDANRHWHNDSPGTINLGSWTSGFKVEQFEIHLVDGDLKRAKPKK